MPSAWIYPVAARIAAAVYAIGVHDAHAIDIVTIRPVVAFLQAAAVERAQVMMNIDNFHIVSPAV